MSPSMHQKSSKRENQAKKAIGSIITIIRRLPSIILECYGKIGWPTGLNIGILHWLKWKIARNRTTALNYYSSDAKQFVWCLELLALYIAKKQDESKQTRPESFLIWKKT